MGARPTGITRPVVVVVSIFAVVRWVMMVVMVVTVPIVVVVVMPLAIVGRIVVVVVVIDVRIIVELMTICEIGREQLFIATAQTQPLALLRLSHLFLLPLPQVTAQNGFAAVRALALPQFLHLVFFEFLHLAGKVCPHLFAGIRPAVGQG